jgi:hypothetical protein
MTPRALPQNPNLKLINDQARHFLQEECVHHKAHLQGRKGVLHLTTVIGHLRIDFCNLSAWSILYLGRMEATKVYADIRRPLAWSCLRFWVDHGAPGSNPHN